MKRYEGLFILNLAGHEDSLKDVIDRISGEIASGGGRIETVQKMDKRNFARAADKKHGSGYYVNFIFEAPPTLIAQLHTRYALDEEVFRVLFTIAPPAAKPAPTA